MVSKIIHQTWKTSQPPIKTLFCIESWKDLNPGFDHILWSDEDIRTFVDRYYPEYLSRIENFQLGIIKADFFRLLALYHFGGIYVDIDFECLVPFEKWNCIKKDKINAAYEPFSHGFIHPSFKQKLCNAFFASPPGMHAYKHLIDAGNSVNDKKPLEVKRSYGPMAWSKLLTKKNLRKEINIIPRRLIYPITDLTNPKVIINAKSIDLIVRQIENRDFDSLAVHYWDHSSSEAPSILDAIDKNDLSLIKDVRSRQQKTFADYSYKSKRTKKVGLKARLKVLLKLLQYRLNLYR